MPESTIHVGLTKNTLDITPWQSWLSDPDTGAHAWFLGVTRRITETDSGATKTQTIHYQAHARMAESELRRIAIDACDSLGLRRVLILHRLGDVPVGQASILVGCCSAHRAPCFTALGQIMEAVKKDVPIWKQEHYEDGSREWLHPDATIPDSAQS